MLILIRNCQKQVIIIYFKPKMLLKSNEYFNSELYIYLVKYIPIG